MDNLSTNSSGGGNNDGGGCGRCGTSCSPSVPIPSPPQASSPLSNFTSYLPFGQVGLITAAAAAAVSSATSSVVSSVTGSNYNNSTAVINGHAMTNCSGHCSCPGRVKTPPAPPPPPKKKSWSELKGVVTELRRQIMNLSTTMAPINVNFRTLSDGRVRIYFLSTPPNGFESTLLYTDVNPSAPQSCMTSSTCSSASGSSEVSSASSEPVAPSSSPPLHQQLLNGSLSQLASSFSAATTSLSTFGESTLNTFGESFTAATTTLSTFGESVMNAAVGLSNSDPELSEPGPRQQLRWNQVLEPTISGLNSNNTASREVQLLLERKRLSTWGITSFELHKESGKIVYPASSTLFQCLDTGFTKGPIFPTELRLSPLWAAFDPQICPQNSDLVAYVCGGDIWVAHTVSGHVERLTYAHDGRRSFSDDSLSAGVPSYVILEEFNRYQGFWWQPHSEDHIYRIAYEEVDESDVGLFTFPTSVSNSGDYEEYRFPRAGTPNAKSKLKLVQFRLSETLHIEDICVKDLHCPLSYAFPWMEYLVRVGWTPDSRFVWAQLLNRLQQRLDIILIPLDNFTEHYSSPTNSPTPGSAPNTFTTPTTSTTNNSSDGWRLSHCERKTYTPIQVIYSQLSDTWVNVHNGLHFLEITDTSCTFVWASEETGFRHLYLITSALHLDAPQTQLESNILKNHLVEVGSAATAGNVDQEMDGSHDQLGGAGGKDLLSANVINKVALTAGDWEVCGQKVWIDKERQIVFFQGLKHTPLEKHLYAVSLQQPGHIRWLTSPGSSYTVHFSDDCTIFMQTYCNIHSLPTCEIMKVDQSCNLGGVNGLQLSSLGYLLKGGAPENFQYCPTIYTEQLKDKDGSGSELIYAMVFKPHNFRLGEKYPTVLHVYGGPEVQVVNNTFKGIRQMRLHMLAAQGYCVICIDSRGSHHRGVKFEGYLRKRMGTVELADQVEILKKLSNQLGYIDMDRVAIHGWSYGGYLCLMGLVQYPEVFKVAIAGAPVTSWENYDTAYTERYMDLPENNIGGYAAGSVLNYVNRFPDEENRLLIIHGLIDENVHFYHTSQLVNALIRLNKPYQLQVYPAERHSLRNLEASKHYETTLLSFLQNYL